MRSVRVLFCLVIGLVLSCNFWASFKQPNPDNCVTSPGICINGQVCNERTRRCEDPAATNADMAAAPDGSVPAVDGGSSTWCSEDGWCWENPQPASFAKYAVWVVGPNDAWVGGVSDGKKSALMHWDGKAWSRLPDNPWGAVYSFWGSSSNDIWAGTDGSIIHYDGKDWSVKLSGFLCQIFAIWGDGMNNLWASCGNSLIHYDGSRWSAENSVFGSDSIVKIGGMDSGHVIAVAQTGSIYDNTGNSWKKSFSGTFPNSPTEVNSAIIFSDGSIFATNYNGEVWYFDGSSWALNGKPSSKLFGIWGTDASHLMAVGEGVYSYDGISWTKHQTDCIGQQYDRCSNFGYYSVHGSSYTNIITISTGSSILQFNGTAWRRLTDGFTWPLNSISGNNVNGPIIVGRSMNIWRSLNQSWSPWDHGIKPSQATDLNTVWAFDTNKIIAAGNNGSIMTYDGATWQLTNIGAEHFLASWASNENNVWLAGKTGALYRFDGTTWSQITSGTSNDLTAIWGTGNDSVWIGGAQNTLLHWTKGTLNSVSNPFTRSIYAIWGSDDANIWISGDPGSLMKYDGANWVQQLAFSSGTGIADLVGFSASDVWAVGFPGIIYHYDGIMWSSQASGTNLALAAVWGTASNNLWAMSLGGGILHRAK